MRFVLPDESALRSTASAAESYAILNYYGRGIIPAIKRNRFQRALDLGGAAPARKVIDMGCADGVLLPTLARHYEQVAAIDVHPEYSRCSKHLTDQLGLGNVDVVCSQDLTFADVKKRIGDGFGLMYLLETLEHIGEPPDLWASKIEFLKSCFSLLDDGGRIVVSVPKMVGLAFLLKYVVQNCFLGVHHDRMTFKQLFKSSVLRSTDDLEPLWDRGHIGFNHLKLDRHLAANFGVVQRKESLISVFYVLRSG